MSKTGRHNYRRAAKGRNHPNRLVHNITVRSVNRAAPDLRKLGRALITKALAETEAETDPASPDMAATAEVKEARHDD